MIVLIWINTRPCRHFIYNYYKPYRFKKNWLTHGYANEDKVKRDLEQKRLPEKSAKAIQGIHMRHESLADEPSALDMELLKKLYKGNVKPEFFARC